MFKFFKRPPAPPVKPARARQPAKATTNATHGRIESAPLPEVIEGNEQSDWALWEDSVVALDSQMQSLGPSSRSFADPNGSTGFDELDPFSRVKKKDA